MKKFRIYIFLALGILACSDDEKLTESVQDNVERGAILRTISLPSPSFDFNDPSQEWIVEVEEQDHEDGALFKEVGVYASITMSASGDTSDEEFIKTVAKSDFTQGPNGLPRGNVGVSLQEVLSGLGLSPGQYESTDFFNIRLELLLNDGRSFSAASAGATVAGGSFFSSPYMYSAQFFCALPDAAAFDGNFVVVTDVWADYATGDVVPVEFVSDYTFRILSANNPFISNTDTSYIEVTIDPATGGATAASNECLNYPGFDCVNVTGSGSVGTCTADVNLLLTFGPYGNYGFTLSKQ